MSAEWFFKAGDREIGPVTFEQLAEMAATGSLSSSCRVRQGENGDWLTADRVNGLLLRPIPTLGPNRQNEVDTIDGGRTIETEMLLATSGASQLPVPDQTRQIPVVEQDQWLEERQAFIDVNAWKTELAATDWTTLFPFGAVLKDRPWSLLWVQLFAFAFCFPFLLIKYYNGKDASLLEAAWAFSLYFAILWGAFLYRCMRPDALGKKHILGTWLFTSFLGVVAVVLIAAIARILPGTRDIVQASKSASIFPRLVGFTLGVGLVEESVKGLPVIWMGLRSRAQLAPTAIAYIGVISGLAFGAAEAIVYSIQYAAGHAAAAISYGDYLIVQVLRFVSLPLLHAIWSGILGYFVGFAVNSATTRRVALIIGLALVSVLHGLYNTFADGWLGFLVAVFSMLLFVGYVRAESGKGSRILDSVATC